MHQDHLEDLLSHRLLGPCSVWFSRSELGLKNLHLTNSHIRLIWLVWGTTLWKSQHLRDHFSSKNEERSPWNKFKLSKLNLGFPCGSAGNESTHNVGDLGSIPGLERSPREVKGYPLQYSGLENSMDCSPWGHKESVRQDWATFKDLIRKLAYDSHFFRDQ